MAFVVYLFARLIANNRSRKDEDLMRRLKTVDRLDRLNRKPNEVDPMVRVFETNPNMLKGELDNLGIFLDISKFIVLFRPQWLYLCGNIKLEEFI